MRRTPQRLWWFTSMTTIASRGKPFIPASQSDSRPRCSRRRNRGLRSARHSSIAEAWKSRANSVESMCASVHKRGLAPTQGTSISRASRRQLSHARILITSDKRPAASRKIRACEQRFWPRKRESARRNPPRPRIHICRRTGTSHNFSGA